MKRLSVLLSRALAPALLFWALILCALPASLPHAVDRSPVLFFPLAATRSPAGKGAVISPSRAAGNDESDFGSGETAGETTGADGYALIGSDTVLYSEAAEDGSREAVTTLPENYFVRLRGVDDDGMFAVTYLDLVGAVRADSVERVDYEPKYKFCTAATLTLSNDGFDVNLRSRPDHTADNVVARLGPAEGVFFYGTTAGTRQTEAVGETWYFVRASFGGKEVRGYVYSLYVSSPVVPDNVIEPVYVPPATPPAGLSPDEPATDPTDDAPVFSLGSGREIAIILALCLPIAVVTVLLFKKNDGSSQEPGSARRRAADKRRDLNRRVRLTAEGDSRRDSDPDPEPPGDDKG